MPFQPLDLSPEDQLDALQFLDEFRFWQSLDDERRCTRCRETITGRQILVIERHGTRGEMRLQCPTPGCPSTPSQWVYANPVLFAAREAFSPRPSHSDQRAMAATAAKYRRTEITDKRGSSRQGLLSFRPGLQRSLLGSLRVMQRLSEGMVGFFRMTNSGRRLRTGTQR